MRIQVDDEWLEIGDEDFQRLLDDSSADCLVDLSGPNGVLFVPLSAMRELRGLPDGSVMTNGDKPDTLYGIPIVYEDNP